MNLDEKNIELNSEEKNYDGQEDMSNSCGFSAAVGNAEQPTEDLVIAIGLCNRRIHFGSFDFGSKFSTEMTFTLASICWSSRIPTFINDMWSEHYAIFL